MYIDKIGEKICSINAHQRCTDGKVTSNCYQVYKVAKIINHFKSLIKKKPFCFVHHNDKENTYLHNFATFNTHFTYMRIYKTCFCSVKAILAGFFYVLLKHHKIEFASFQQCEKLIAKNEHNV